MWWLTTAGKRVYVPDTLEGLPRYKADTVRLFLEGQTDLILRGVL